MADDASEVFPDVDPMQAAYQLFLVHVDEELATHVVAGSEMRLGDDGGWRTLAAPPARHVRPPTPAAGPTSG